MRKFRRMFAFVMALAVVLSGQCVTAWAYEAPEAAEAGEAISPRMLFTGTVEVESDSTVVFTVEYTCNEDLGNSSGLYIRSIDSVTISSRGEFVYVDKTSVNVLSTTYFSNHQRAVIEVSFKGREGYASATATTYYTTLDFSIN